MTAPTCFAVEFTTCVNSGPHLIAIREANEARRRPLALRSVASLRGGQRGAIAPGAAGEGAQNTQPKYFTTNKQKASMIKFAE